MTIFQAFILGIIQGLTEFAPISSSAHLVLFPFFIGWNIPKEQIFSFDVLVQVGTLMAVMIFFWKDLIKIIQNFLIGLVKRQPFKDNYSRLGWYLILATIPAGLIGLLTKSYIEKAFQSPFATALFLLFTATLLLGSEYLGNRKRQFESITWKDALAVGFFQVLSLFPGVSRSGTTITGGMTQNLSRFAAARFSFLISIPVMLAAGLLSSIDLIHIPNLTSFIPVLITGFLTSMVVGYISIHWLLSFISSHSLKVFAWYCIALSLISLIIIYVH